MTEEREQPVVPFALVTPRSKPPSNHPQVTPALLSRSPMFWPLMLVFLLVEEQTSPAGSASEISAWPPLPSGTAELPRLSGLSTPSVWPETRLRASIGER